MTVSRFERGSARVWLVRHGESDWNVGGLAQGQACGPVLTPRGAAQCARAARWLVGTRAAVVVSSDLARARQSAQIIAGALDLPVVVEPALRERALGAAEGRPSEVLASTSGIRHGRVEDADRAPEGGETVRQLYERVSGFARTFTPPDHGETVLVVHGGVIRVWLAWSRGLAPDAMAWPPIPNGAVFACELPRRAVAPPLLTSTAQR